MNNFENIINCRVDIREDIKCYQDTLSYASSKADYSAGENIYMLPIDMNLSIKSGTVGYSNKILVSNGKFSLGKNDKVNTLEPAKHTFITKATMKSHKTVAQSTATPTSLSCTDLAQKPTITHEEEKVASTLFLTVAFTIWYMFH